MEFTIVDIPVGPAVSTSANPIVEALLKNIGKAISIPCGDKDPNTVRKNLRQSLSNRKLLKKYIYRTRSFYTPKEGDSDALGTSTLIAWLEEKQKAASILEDKDRINPAEVK